jgi:hypothetical protein
MPPGRVSPFARLYQQRSDQVRSQLSRITVGLFNAMPNWDNPDALAVPAAAISTRAQTVQAGLLRAMFTTMSGGDRPDLEVASVTGDAVRGGDIVGSWRIPIYALWQSMSDGSMSQVELSAQAQNDVSDQALTDLAYSQRDAAAQLSENTDGVIGYWRVPNGGSACDFCTEIADQLYHTEDLMEVHPGCQCSVEPAFAGEGG